MIIQNRLETSKFRMLYIVSLAVFVFTAFFAFYSDIPKGEYFTTGIALGVLFIYFSMIYIDYKYVYFNDNGEKIVFRYVSAHPVIGKRKAIEIKKKSFAGYEIQSAFFGLKRLLVLKMFTKKGIIKYPPISVSAIKNHDLKLIEKGLNQQLAMNVKLISKFKKSKEE